MTERDVQKATNESVLLINEAGEEESVPLLDVQRVLTEHLRETVVQTSQGALVFRTIRYSDFRRIQHTYKGWITKNQNDMVESQRLIEKKDNGKKLAKAEEDLLARYSLSSFPYTSALIHAMLVRPVMEMDTFQTLIREALLPEDWTRIQKTATNILKLTYINVQPKN